MQTRHFDDRRCKAVYCCCWPSIGQAHGIKDKGALRRKAERLHPRLLGRCQLEILVHQKLLRLSILLVPVNDLTKSTRQNTNGHHLTGVNFSTAWGVTANASHRSEMSPTTSTLYPFTTSKIINFTRNRTKFLPRHCLRPEPMWNKLYRYSVGLSLVKREGSNSKRLGPHGEMLVFSGYVDIHTGVPAGM
jgi:hypothetical protein